MESKELALTMVGSPPERVTAGGSVDSANILLRARAGDRAAFNELILLHERRVLMTAWRLLGSKEDAQDAAQEVFLRLYKHIHRVDPARPLAPWLYRITVNVCRDLYRQRRLADAELAEDVNPAALAWNPAAETLRIEQRQVIALALQSLSEKERAAVVLRDIEGLSTAEVADILGSREATVRSQISMARVKIRKFIDRLEKKRT